MKTLETLSRARYKKLYNLLPGDIGRKAFPPFFTTIKETYIDWESLNKNYSEELIKNENEKKDESTRKRNKQYKNSQTSSKTSFYNENKQVKFDQQELKAKPIQFTPYSQTAALYDKGCITCGIENIKVDFYEERHMCLECRSFLKTYYEDPAILFLNEIGDIKCYGVKNVTENQETKKVYYQVKEDQLKFNKYRAYATIAGPEELIVLLHDNQEIK